MKHLTPAEAREFAGRWLPAWTGNDRSELLARITASRRTK